MSKNAKMGRRELLRAAGSLFAVSVAVPAGLSACVAGGESPTVVTSNPIWDRRAAQLEQGDVLTMSNPGPFAGKEMAHVPRVSFDSRAGSVTLENTHPMMQDHWITTHYVRDQNGVIFGLREFRSDDVMARATFAVPPGTTSVTAYVYCSVHSSWRSDRVGV